MYLIHLWGVASNWESIDLDFFVWVEGEDQYKELEMDSPPPPLAKLVRKIV